MIADALRDEGVTVIEAGSGDEAWQHIQLDPDIDVVFTDHRMPGTLSGAELAGRVRELRPGIVVVLTSGDFDGKGYRGALVRKPYFVLEVARELASLGRSNRRVMDA